MDTLLVLHFRHEMRIVDLLLRLLSVAFFGSADNMRSLSVICELQFPCAALLQFAAMVVLSFKMFQDDMGQKKAKNHQNST